MTPVEHLLRRVELCGFAVRLSGDGPALNRIGPGEMKPALLAELKANRAAIVEHLRANPPGEQCEEHHCDECGKTLFIHDGDRDTAFLVCQISGSCSVLCPFWRPGLGPDWMGRARSSEEWSRRKRAAKAEQVSEPVPE